MKKALSAAALGTIAFAVAANAQFTTTDTPNQGTANGDISVAETRLTTLGVAGPNEPYVNFGDNSGVVYPSSPVLPFPGYGPGTGGSNFDVSVSGLLTFNTAGTYVFHVNSDDGFRLRLDPTSVPNFGETTDTYSEFDAPRGPSDTAGGTLTETAGATTNALLSYYQDGGGAELQLTYTLNGGPTQQLVGTTADISVAPIPEPATFAALLGGAGMLLGLRRRRA